MLMIYFGQTFKILIEVYLQQNQSKTPQSTYIYKYVCAFKILQDIFYSIGHLISSDFFSYSCVFKILISNIARISISMLPPFTMTKSKFVSQQHKVDAHTLYCLLFVRGKDDLANKIIFCNFSFHGGRGQLAQASPYPAPKGRRPVATNKQRGYICI